MTEVLTYEALKADRDAQQKRADALAVENAGLKNAITTHSQSTHFCELCGKDDPCSTDDVCYVLNETPATDAALAAIEARGVEKLLDSEHCSQEAHGCVCRYLDELREAK